jgi:hypothetical protein
MAFIVFIQPSTKPNISFMGKVGFEVRLVQMDDCCPKIVK